MWCSVVWTLICLSTGWRLLAIWLQAGANYYCHPKEGELLNALLQHSHPEISSSEQKCTKKKKKAIVPVLGKKGKKKKKGCSGCPFPDCFHFPAGPCFAPELWKILALCEVWQMEECEGLAAQGLHRGALGGGGGREARGQAGRCGVASPWQESLWGFLSLPYSMSRCIGVLGCPSLARALCGTQGILLRGKAALTQQKPPAVSPIQWCHHPLLLLFSPFSSLKFPMNVGQEHLLWRCSCFETCYSDFKDKTRFNRFFSFFISNFCGFVIITLQLISKCICFNWVIFRSVCCTCTRGVSWYQVRQVERTQC